MLIKYNVFKYCINDSNNIEKINKFKVKFINNLDYAIIVDFAIVS